MAYRPYFKHGIEQIQELVVTSRNDLKVLKVIQYELGRRNRPKARALKAEVDELVRKLSTGAVVPPGPPVTPPTEWGPEAPAMRTPPVAADRVVVECANCKTPNFVSTLQGVVQHLSCSACKSPYEAQFKYGVMRTIFRAKPTAESSSAGIKWIFIGLFVLVIIVLLVE